MSWHHLVAPVDLIDGKANEAAEPTDASFWVCYMVCSLGVCVTKYGSSCALSYVKKCFLDTAWGHHHDQVWTGAAKDATQPGSGGAWI